MATERAAAGFTRQGEQHEHAKGQGSQPPSRSLRQQRRWRRWRRKEMLHATPARKQRDLDGKRHPSEGAARLRWCTQPQPGSSAAWTGSTRERQPATKQVAAAAAARAEMATERAAAGFTRRGDEQVHAEGQGSRPPSMSLQQQQHGRRWRRKEKWLASHDGGDQHEHAGGQGSRPPSRSLRQQRRGRRWREREQRLASHDGVISRSTPRGKAAGHRAGRCGSSGEGGDGERESSGWLHTTG